MSMLPEAYDDALRIILDHNSMPAVLEALAGVCGERARAHESTNYDEARAAACRAAERKLTALAVELDI